MELFTVYLYINYKRTLTHSNTSFFEKQLQQINLIFQIQQQQNELQNYKTSSQKKKRWTKQEDQLLIQQIKLFGINECKKIQIDGKTTSQIYFRLRYLKEAYLQNKGRKDLQWLRQFEKE
ncbi:SANT/Myb_domain [Hexamita inflata]|uniref:SANT/Myb domain n=1 Tax=Hexamita inflata TaxID=28002 RepID=A0AA86PFT1_9EUKA|nr:SANT/Myb domain [Hexamita inflata]